MTDNLDKRLKENKVYHETGFLPIQLGYKNLHYPHEKRLELVWSNPKLIKEVKALKKLEKSNLSHFGFVEPRKKNTPFPKPILLPVENESDEIPPDTSSNTQDSDK